MNQFWDYTSESHGMPLSNLVKVNNKTVQIRCKGFLSCFVQIVNMFSVYNSVSHGMLLSNSVKVNNKTIKI